MTRTLSLTSRLTLLFGLILMCVLATLGFYIFNAMQSHFVEQDEVFLAKHAEEIRDELQQPIDLAFTGEIGKKLGHIMPRHDIDFVIVAQNGDVLSRHETAETPAATVKQLLAEKPGVSVLWSAGHENYRSLLIRSERFGVIASISTHHHDVFLDSFGKRLLLILSLIFGVTWGLSWVAIRQGLAPLGEIRDRASAVTLSNLNKAIPLDHLPGELVPLAAELNVMLRRLEGAFHRLVAFSSDLAHEMRTPVSNLLTQTQVVLAQSRTADAYRDVLASNAEEAERLSRMIAEMLFLAKAENGTVLPSVEQVDLAEQVSETLEYYEALAESKGMTLKRTGHAVLTCDRSMLRRALSNLVSNAIRYGAPNSAIETDITSGVHEITISVTNRGADILPEHSAHIFDRFYRADAARSHEDQGGVGLGLSITRAIMLAHGGTADVESKDGSTTFRLVFPAQSQASI